MSKETEIQKRGVILNKLIRKYLLGICEQRLQGGTEVNHEIICGKHFSRRVNSKCKGPEEEVSLEMLGTASLVRLKETDPGVG